MRRAGRVGWLRIIALCIVVLLGAVWGASTSDGPWGPLPGGRLHGADEPCAGVAWRDYAAVEEWEVEVRPERPRSVTTWSVVHDDTLFLPADFLTPVKRWPHQVAADPRIRLRAGARIFRCRAVRVFDTALIAVLRIQIAAKYRLASDGVAARTQVWWFRVTPR